MENYGERLKKVRLEKGISLEEAHKKTKVHLNILKAIEGDTITDLNPVYLKGFLKIYCNFLGVNPADFSAEQKEARPQRPQENRLRETAQEPREPAVLSETAIKVGSTGLLNKLKPAVFIMLAVLAASFVFFKLGKVISSTKKKPAQQERLAAISALLNEKKEKPAAHAAAQKPVVNKIILVISAKEKCFVQVKADGGIVFRGDLAKKRSETYSANEKIELVIGNAGAVELTVNGRHFPSIGKKGQARKNILITKEGMNLGK